MSARTSGQSRIAQACKRCRSLKTKCVPSDQPSVCLRCLNTDRDCVWPDTRNGGRKPRGPSRISQVEKKIDGLVAQIARKNSSDGTHLPSDHPSAYVDESPLSQEHEVRSGAASGSSPYQTFSNHIDDDKDRAASLLQRIADVHDFELDQEDEGSENDPTLEDSRSEDERLVTRLLADERAQNLLERYRNMAPHFPFVLIGPNMTAEKMSRRTPMLLLAIMTVASYEHHELQRRLEKQYKQELALRTIIEPRKDLALLQSMLVYLAWYHYYIDPKLQTSALIQMCVGLVAELKLDPDYITKLLPGRDTTKRVRYGRDGQRALLGCYYLCSINASGLRRSNNFKISNHMYRCAQRLEQDQEFGSDRVLSVMIHSRHLDDRIFDFHHATGVNVQNPTQDQLLAQIGVWESSLDELKEMARELDDATAITSSIHAMSLELYDSLFHLLRTCDPTSKILALVDVKIRVLSSCLEAGRSFLDALLSISTDDLAFIPFTLWVPLPRVLITLAMLTAPSEHHLPQWNVKTARDRVRLDLFLESLCFRMQSLSRFNPPMNTNPDYWLAMKTVLQSVGKWYKRISNREQDRSVTRHNNSERPSPWNASLPSNQAQEWHTSGAASSQSYSANSLAHTPESAGGYHSTQPGAPPAFQQMFSSITCPMMGGMSNGLDIDQFMDMGFWGDINEGLDIMNFDFSA